MTRVLGLLQTCSAHRVFCLVNQHEFNEVVREHPIDRPIGKT
jgi:hypothetical protein